MTTTLTNGIPDGERTRKRELPDWMYSWGQWPDVTQELSDARELLAEWVHLRKRPSQVDLTLLTKATREFLQEKR